MNEITDLEITIAANRQRDEIEEVRRLLLFERVRTQLDREGFLFASDRGELPIDNYFSAAGQPDVVTNGAPAVPDALTSQTDVAESDLVPSNSVPAVELTKSKFPQKTATAGCNELGSLLPHSRPPRFFSPQNRRAHRLAFYLALSPQFRRFD